MAVKVCRKCNWGEETNATECPHPKCDGKMAFWVSRNEDLVSEFSQYSDKQNWKNPLAMIFKLGDNEYGGLHPGWKIDWVLRRLKFVELLHTNETHGPFIEAGFNNESSLRLHLTSTCFDIIGGQKKFRTFNDWVNGKKASIKEERESYLKHLDFKEIDNAEVFLQKITGLITTYDEIYGMSRGIQRFFWKFLTDKDRNIITTLLWIGENPYPGSATKVSLVPASPEWIAFSEEEKLKKVINAIVNVCRNKFSHEGLPVVDLTDKDHIFPVLRKIEALLKLGKKFQLCTSQDDFTSKVEDASGFNKASVGFDGDQLFIFFRDLTGDPDDVARSILEHCSQEIIKNGEIFLDYGLKKALCWRGMPLTRLLIHLAKCGLYTYIMTEGRGND